MCCAGVRGSVARTMGTSTCKALPALLAAACVAAGCGASASSDKAGGATKGKPVVLTLANGNGDSVELEPFAAAVARLSGGTLRIVFKNGWRRGSPSYEIGAIGDVRSGRVDLAWAGSRAFDSVGVPAFDALHAPLLVDTYALEQAVLRSPLVPRMLGGLRRLGVVGLGILPGPMRKPLGASPLVRPEDYRAKTLAIARSQVAAETLDTLGARAAEIPSQGRIDGDDGVEQQIASIQGNFYDRVGHYLTANVNLWPRPLVLFINEKVLNGLSDRQRPAMRGAAHAALGATLAADRHDEQEAAATLCRRGLRFVTATDGDLAALRRAVASVYDRLDRDAQTKDAIAQITAMRGEVTATANSEAPRCATTAPTSAAAKATPIDGVYRLDTTAAESRAAGTPPTDLVSENYGHWRFVLDRGRLYYTQSSEGASRWTRATYTVNGDILEYTVTAYGGEAPHGAAEKTGEVFTFRWSRYRDRLTLAPVKGKISPLNFRLKPWRRVGDAP
jgi:TRAP-type C4-dicarboxylate transport system substrate-binding protein